MSAQAASDDRIIGLDIVKGKVFSVTLDGKSNITLVDGIKDSPDGVQLDAQAGKLYWSCMGADPNANDGRIMSANMHGTEIKTLIGDGKTHTPKQLHLEEDTQTLYWCDREGGRIWSCQTDGSKLEMLYDSAPDAPRPLADESKRCVGITIDSKRQLLYWSQKGPSKGGKGRICRMSLSNHSEIETLYENLPEPIDLTLNSTTQTLYWTDRGDPPFGNTLNSADVSSGLDTERSPKSASQDLVIADHFHEAIGLVADFEKDLIYVSDLMGSLWCVNIKEKTRKVILADQGNFTGITLQRGKTA